MHIGDFKGIMAISDDALGVTAEMDAEKLYNSTPDEIVELVKKLGPELHPDLDPESTKYKYAIELRTFTLLEIRVRMHATAKLLREKKAFLLPVGFALSTGEAIEFNAVFSMVSQILGLICFPHLLSI